MFSTVNLGVAMLAAVQVASPLRMTGRLICVLDIRCIDYILPPLKAFCFPCQKVAPFSLELQRNSFLIVAPFKS